MGRSSIQYQVHPGKSVSGRLRVPGDKSISHRSILLGSLAEGTTRVIDFLEGEDSLATVQAFRDMGVQIKGPVDGELSIKGVGINGLRKPEHPLNLGNSGTALRLFCGLLAGQRFESRLIGDQSLSSRPMRRITTPLAQMGAHIETTQKGTAPIRIKPVNQLSPLHYQMPVASAQVKSCLLLAGLYAEGKTCVFEPAPTRDHTERMLGSFGYQVLTKGRQICIEGGGKLKATTIEVPGDISSAAFLLVAASIAEHSELLIRHVGINPTRDGILKILGLMGADIKVQNRSEIGNEPVADLLVRSAPLHGIEIPSELVPLAIDEFPVIFVAAACATGKTVLTNAEELRVKESDRIEVMAQGLKKLGIKAKVMPDGMIIEGGQIGSGEVDSQGDHRIAMAFAVASLRASGEIRINDCANVNTSFPGFAELCNSVGFKIEVHSQEV